MAFFSPSEVARLILGYLRSIQCEETRRTFLSECPHLREFVDYLNQTGQELPTYFAGKSLLELLSLGYEYQFLAQHFKYPLTGVGLGGDVRVPNQLATSGTPEAMSGVSSRSYYPFLCVNPTDRILSTTLDEERVVSDRRKNTASASTPLVRNSTGPSGFVSSPVTSDVTTQGKRTPDSEVVVDVTSLDATIGKLPPARSVSESGIQTEDLCSLREADDDSPPLRISPSGSEASSVLITPDTPCPASSASMSNKKLSCTPSVEVFDVRISTASSTTVSVSTRDAATTPLKIMTAYAGRSSVDKVCSPIMSHSPKRKCVHPKKRFTTIPSLATTASEAFGTSHDTAVDDTSVEADKANENGTSAKKSFKTVMDDFLHAQLAERLAENINASLPEKEIEMATSKPDEQMTAGISHLSDDVLTDIINKTISDPFTAELVSYVAVPEKKVNTSLDDIPVMTPMKDLIELKTPYKQIADSIHSESPMSSSSYYTDQSPMPSEPLMPSPYSSLKGQPPSNRSVVSGCDQSPTGYQSPGYYSSAFEDSNDCTTHRNNTVVASENNNNDNDNISQGSVCANKSSDELSIIVEADESANNTKETVSRLVKTARYASKVRKPPPKPSPIKAEDAAISLLSTPNKETYLRIQTLSPTVNQTVDSGVFKAPTPPKRRSVVTRRAVSLLKPKAPATKAAPVSSVSDTAPKLSLPLGEDILSQASRVILENSPVKSVVAKQPRRPNKMGRPPKGTYVMREEAVGSSEPDVVPVALSRASEASETTSLDTAHKSQDDQLVVGYAADKSSTSTNILPPRLTCSSDVKIIELNGSHYLLMPSSSGQIVLQPMTVSDGRYYVPLPVSMLGNLNGVTTTESATPSVNAPSITTPCVTTPSITTPVSSSPPSVVNANGRQTSSNHIPVQSLPTVQTLTSQPLSAARNKTTTIMANIDAGLLSSGTAVDDNDQIVKRSVSYVSRAKASTRTEKPKRCNKTNGVNQEQQKTAKSTPKKDLCFEVISPPGSSPGDDSKLTLFSADGSKSVRLSRTKSVTSSPSGGNLAAPHIRMLDFGGDETTRSIRNEEGATRTDSPSSHHQPPPSSPSPHPHTSTSLTPPKKRRKKAVDLKTLNVDKLLDKVHRGSQDS